MIVEPDEPIETRFAVPENDQWDTESSSPIHMFCGLTLSHVPNGNAGRIEDDTVSAIVAVESDRAVSVIRLLVE